MHNLKKILAAFFCATVLAGGCWQTAQAQTGQVRVLYSFTNTDGADPLGGLCAGQDGNFYGTTAGGGTNGGYGTVFKVTTNGLLTSLVSFAGNNGSFSHSELVQGNDGNFYGTTAGGGTNSYGTVFVVTTNGLLTSLVSFALTNGAYPDSDLTLGNDGNFYGTAYYGGSSNLGTAFQVTTNGVLTTLVSFSNTNGALPIAGLTLGNDGNFYGTTAHGGTNSGDYGTIFQVTTNGVLTSLVSFNNTNGANPSARLTFGNDNNFYGTTSYGGTNGLGTVFKVTTNGVLTTLASFNNTNGANPIAGLTLGSDGNFYGTTVNGGSSNLGTAFQVTTNGVLTTLVSFNNTNGANPRAGWTPGIDGNFYGATANGGAATNGTVLKLIVPPMLGPVSFTSQTPQVAVNGLARPSIQIQVTTNLTASWSVLTNLVFTNGTGLVIDPAAANAPQRFYRAVVQ
jgi:uncharacterized repeat protein (TIGR03803 family)